MLKQATLTITGRVQGVFYRSEAQSQALKLGVSGYAKNNRDGSVTVVAIGEETDLQKFIDWCRRGPELARVENVEITYEQNPADINEAKEEHQSFEIY